MQDPSSVYLSYNSFRKLRYVLLATIFGLAIYYGLGYAFIPDNFTMEGVTLLEVATFLVFDQLLIESVTVFIFFRLIEKYATAFRLNRTELNVRSFLRYQASFIPLALLAFFVFFPIPHTLRFLLRYFGSYSWDLYWLDFFSWPLYFTYLGAFTPIMYLGLNLNLLGEYKKQVNLVLSDESKRVQSPSSYISRIVGHRDGAAHTISVDKVLWFETRDRHYYAVTETGQYRISKTMRVLEAELDPTKFFRLTRSVITNIDGIASFSPWIDGKYVVRMLDKRRTDFTVSRIRVKQFRHFVGQSG